MSEQKNESKGPQTKEKDTFLAMRSSFTRICLGSKSTGRVLAAISHRSNLNKEQASVIHFDRSQEKLIEDMQGQVCKKTLHDTSIPLLQLLGMIDVDQTTHIHRYTVYADRLKQARELAKQPGMELEKFLIAGMELEKFLIPNEKREELEKLLFSNEQNFSLEIKKLLITVRETSHYSDSKRGRKRKVEAPSGGVSKSPKKGYKNLEELREEDITVLIANASTQARISLLEKMLASFSENDPEVMDVLQRTGWNTSITGTPSSLSSISSVKAEDEYHPDFNLNNAQGDDYVDSDMPAVGPDSVWLSAPVHGQTAPGGLNAAQMASYGPGLGTQHTDVDRTAYSAHSALNGHSSAAGTDTGNAQALDSYSQASSEASENDNHSHSERGGLYGHRANSADMRDCGSDGCDNRDALGHSQRTLGHPSTTQGQEAIGGADAQENITGQVPQTVTGTPRGCATQYNNHDSRVACGGTLGQFSAWDTHDRDDSTELLRPQTGNEAIGAGNSAERASVPGSACTDEKRGVDASAETGRDTARERSGRGVKGAAQSKKEDALTPEERERWRKWKKIIVDNRGGDLLDRGKIVNEATEIRKVIARFNDAQLHKIWWYMTTQHFKWSKPDFKHTIGGYTFNHEANGIKKTLEELRKWPADEEGTQLDGQVAAHSSTRERATVSGLPNMSKRLEEMYRQFAGSEAK